MSMLIIASTSGVTTDAVKLATPSLSVSIIDSTHLTCNWTSVTNATEYFLERSTDNATWVNVYNGSLLMFADSGLTPNTTYYYRIKSTADGFSNSDFYFANQTTPFTDYVYSLSQTSTTVTDFNRDGTRCMQIGSYYYSFGGWVPGNSFSDVYRTLDLITWVKVTDAAPWVGRHAYGIGKIGTRTYIWGGDTFHPNMDVWSTDDGETWTEDTALMPMAYRIIFGHCYDSSYIYIIGGQHNFDLPPGGPYDVWRSPNGADWTKMGDGRTEFSAVLAGACVYFPDTAKLYVISGSEYGGDSTTYSKKMFSSADGGATWTAEPDVPFQGRYYLDTVYWDNKIWVICGYYQPSGNLRDIWYMDASGTWTQFMDVPTGFVGRHATGVGVFNDKLVISNGNFNNDCWMIEKLPA